MQLNPEFAYAVGGPFTPDQAALVVSTADPTGHGNGQPSAHEQARFLEAEQIAKAGEAGPPEEGDHDTCPYRAST